ncbi:DivIVA domain-containing protein [Actinoalloteichus hoggarensis]|uniref:DivIVA domain-containing protein n=1 Tax=Actinoalloteichus hoggarensis TaxID=1470176 RepID=UPI000B8A9953|nr:DivIVA domain-containing protein [Actinoalloteichus hoggarensis]
MTTLLIYLAVMLLVAAVVFLLVSVIFGSGEELAPLPPGVTPTTLPETSFGGAEVRALRFQQAVRGYRMTEVDWALEKVAAELDGLRSRVSELERELSERSAPDTAAGAAGSTAEAEAAPVIEESAALDRRKGTAVRSGHADEPANAVGGELDVESPATWSGDDAGPGSRA